MVCPNKNSKLFKELENYLGDEVKADIAFRLNKNKLPDYKNHPDFKLYKQYYGESEAFNRIFKDEIAKYEKSRRVETGPRQLTINDFLKKWPMTSKFLPSSYSPSKVATDARKVGLDIKKATNGSYYLTRNGRGFDPSSPVFKLSESAKKNPKKVMEAEKKWIKSKLGKDFPVDIAHQSILGQAWGMFSDQAISLYENAGEGTGYHETFHAVFRMALNPQERQAILLEAKARKSNENKTDNELEEILADEFAEYIMRDGKMDLPKAQNNFYKQLLDFIKNLFNLDIDIASLYEGIDQGRFYNLHLDYKTRNKVNPETGVAFKRIPIELTRIDNNGVKVTNSTLTEGETLAVMESIDSAFFKSIFKESDPAALFKNPKWNVKKTYEKVRQKMINDGVFLNAIDNMVDAGISDFKIDDYENIIDTVFGIKYDSKIENYVVDPKKDFLWQTTIESHLKRLKDYGIKTNGYNIETEDTYVSADDFNDISSDIEDEIEKDTNDSAMYKASIEFDAKDGIPPAAKAMLLGITQKSIDKDGKIYVAPTDLNDMYFPKLVDNGKLFTVLASNLVGYSGDFTGMVDKLRSFTEEHPEHASSIRQIMSRLNLQNTTYVSTHRLKSAFTQAFSKAKLTQALTLFKEDGTIGLLDSNTDTLRNKLLSEWDAKFKVKAKRTDIGEPYISANNMGAALAKSKQINNTVGAMMFLKDMGISIDRRALYTNIDGESVVDRIFNMLETFENSSLIDPFNNKEIKGTLNAIAVAQTEYSSDIVELSHLNAEGKRVYGITLNSEITLMAEKINKYAGQGDAIYQDMPYLNNPYTGNSIFLNEIKKRGGKLHIGLLEGNKSENLKEGAVTKKLGLTDKFIQTIDATLKGRYPLLRAGDRGLEYSIALNGGDLLITNSLNGAQVFKRYLADEISTMRVKISDKLDHFDNRNEEFRFFQDIITDSVIEPAMLKAMIDSKEDPLKMIEANDTINSNVEKAITDHFKKETTKTIKFLKEEAGIDKNTGIDTELLNQYESFNSLIENYVYNSTAAYIEQTKLFIGDPIYFNTPTDFFKRISMFNSTKKVSRNDQEYNDFMNSKRKDGEKSYDGLIRTAVFEDIKKGSDLISNLKETLKAKYKNKSSEELDKILSPYTNYEEADAQGYVSLESYREILDRAGDWTADHEKLYSMIIDGKKLPDNAFVYFNPLKTQYAGPMQDFENQLFVPTAAKHSLFPIHPRLLPEGSELAEVANQMKEKGLDFIQFKSANKYGTKLNADGNMNTFYDSNGELNINADNLATQNLYFDFFGIQLDLLGDTKTNITPGSQASKLIVANLFVDGKPLPGYETIVNEYTDTVNRLTAYNEAQVEKDLGVGKNEIGRYVVTDIDVFKNTLQRINSDKNVDDNVKDSLATLETEDKLEYLPNFDKIQSVLTSYINKNIIRAKRPGGSKVQVASTGFIKAKKADGKYGSDRLKFYRKDKSGVMAMQVLLPHWMKDVKANIAPGELDSRLNKLIGFRIPTQGASSMEFVEVVGYLPPEGGDAIVVPSEHVAKTGSDFDIDKLNLYYPSYDVVNGKPVYITQDYQRKGKDFTKEKLHNKLLELQIEIASSDSYFADMVTPLDSELLKEVRNSIKLPSDMSMTEMFSGVTNMEKFRDFLAGKAGVGQVAIHITHHALSQIAGLSATTGDFLFYNHNKNEKGLPSFGNQTSKNKEHYISDVLSGFLNAYVDIAKDPYIFDLNAGSQTANTIFFMLRNGADPEWVMHFISQPILKQYVKQSSINESLMYKHKNRDKGAEGIITTILKDRGLSKANMHYKTARRIGYHPTYDEKDVNDINKIRSEYNKQIPLSTLKSNHRSDQHNIQQRVLDEFLMYQDQAKLLQNSVKGAAVDTKGMGKSFNTVYELNDILNTIDNEGYIENNDKLFSSTFLKGYKDTLSKYHSVFTDKTIITGEVRENISSIYNNLKSNVAPSGRERLQRDLDSQYINYLFNLGLESDTSINRTQIEQFFDKDTLAGMVNDLKKDPALNKNLLIKELIMYFDEGSFATHGMKMYSKKFDTYTKNALIDSFRDLFGLRINGVNIGEFIAKFGLVQGGTRNTLTSYGDLIPYEKFKLYLKENIKKGINSQSFNDFHDMFLRTNVNYLHRVKYTLDNRKRLVYKKYETEAKQPYLVNWEKNIRGKSSPVLYEPSTKTKKGEVIFAPSDRGVIGNAPYRFDFRGINHVGNKTVKWDPRDAKNVKEAKETKQKCKKTR